MSGDYVSVQQAGEKLELSAVQVTDLCESGLIVSEFAGRRRRISRVSLDAYAASLTPEPS